MSVLKPSSGRLTLKMANAIRICEQYGVFYRDDPDAHAVVASGETGVYDGQAWINWRTCAALERRGLGKVEGWGEEAEFILFNGKPKDLS